MREVAITASPAALAAWALGEHGEISWLDDAGQEPGWSYVAWRPQEVAEGAAKAWAALRAAAARPARGARRGPPFTSGLVGWLGYDASRPRPGLARPRVHQQWPAARLARHDALLAHHPAHGWWWTGAGPPPALPPDLPEPPPPEPVAGAAAPEAGAAWHRAAVARILAAIARGEMYEANLTLRLRGEAGDPFGLYLGFRRQSGSPYGAYLAGPGWAMGCGSPELLLAGRGRQVRSEPMKGTRPAGAGGENLAMDEKERAELAIAVDLVRDDLFRVCDPHSVQVGGFPDIRHLPTVVQAVAEVAGTLRPSRRPWQALRQLLPSGSVTGAPRATVMPLLEELEQSPRGPYTGALGWFAAAGDICAALPIRTFLWREGRLEYGVGGGITRRSEAASEWAECQSKAAALAACLGGGVAW